MCYELQLVSPHRPLTDDEKRDMRQAQVHRMCKLCCKCVQNLQEEKEKPRCQCQCGCPVQLPKSTNDVLWSSKFSFNWVMYAKYWSVRSHFHGHTLRTILRELKRAIKTLTDEGVCPHFVKDCHESTKPAFLFILTEFFHSLRQLGNLRSKEVRMYGIDYLFKGQGISNYMWEVDSQVPEEKSRYYWFVESANEIMLMDRTGPIIIKDRGDAQSTYFRLLEEGRSEDDPTVQILKARGIKFSYARPY